MARRLILIQANTCPSKNNPNFGVPWLSLVLGLSLMSQQNLYSKPWNINFANISSLFLFAAVPCVMHTVRSSWFNFITRGAGYGGSLFGAMTPSGRQPENGKRWLSLLWKYRTACSTGCRLARERPLRKEDLLQEKREPSTSHLLINMTKHLPWGSDSAWLTVAIDGARWCSGYGELETETTRFKSPFSLEAH